MNIKRKILAFLLILTLCVSMTPGTAFAINNLKVIAVYTQSSINVVKGKSIALEWSTYPDNTLKKTVSWKSENEKVAIVSAKGVVKGIRTGKTTITARGPNGFGRAVCTVNVSAKAVKTKKIYIKRAWNESKRMRLKVKTKPANATTTVIKWKSSNTKIATVNKVGIVTKLKEGKATITAKAGGKTAKYVVTVKKQKYPKVPRMSFSNYPEVDGSTATLPLAGKLLYESTGYGVADHYYFTSVSWDMLLPYKIFTTTDPSYKALSKGKADMLLVYEASDNTKKKVAGYSKFQIKPIGRDALVFLVNKSNPVQSLTTEQIRDIYSGKITNWKEVGGADKKIKPYQRQEDSGSQTMMKKLVMKGLKISNTPTIPVESTMGGLIDKIGEDTDSIGYSVYYYAHGMYDMDYSRLINVDGVSPTNDTIKSGAYPHVNDFFCVLPQKPTRYAKRLSNWLLSAEGQKFVADCGYVPIK